MVVAMSYDLPHRLDRHLCLPPGEQLTLLALLCRLLRRRRVAVAVVFMANVLPSWWSHGVVEGYFRM